MMWMEIQLACHGDAIFVAGRGCRGERTRTRPLGPAFTLHELGRFRVDVGNAVARLGPLEGAGLEQARALYAALFDGELQDVYVRLAEAAAGRRERLLVRITADDPRLQAVPWEAACRPQTSHGFLASAADIVVARGVSSVEPCEPREVRRALRVLPVLAIDDASLLLGLRQILADDIAAGAIELLPPIAGAAVRNPTLFELLRAGPPPHVLHFYGHGGFDRHDNPVIRLADDEHGERSFLPVEVFAEELRGYFGNLRLIYLQACSGARPGAFASAAETFARSGVDAVVAHLWPVKADVARAATRDFYRTLVGARAGAGDVGASIQASRRTLLGEGAQGLSPVLTLRGQDTRLFDLEGRRLSPPTPVAAVDEARDVSAPFRRIAGGSFSAIVGSVWDDASLRTIHERLRDAVGGLLAAQGERTDPNLPLYSLAQRLALLAGPLKLNRLFQKVLGGAYQRGEIPASVDALAPLLRPGVHTTLLWLPLLEHALLRHHPRRPLYVVQPGLPNGDERRLIMVKRPDEPDWEELGEVPRIDLDDVFVVMRLYGGYSPEQVPVLTTPQLTEDDHIQGLVELRYIVPPEWERAMLGWLRSRPVMCVGLSALDWRHRMLLRWLFDQRPPPAGSLVVLGESQREEAIWEARGAGLPGPSSFTAFRAATDLFVAALRGALP